MKKSAILFLAFMISGIAFGQERQQRGQQKSPEESAKTYTERLTKQLKLSTEQQKQIYELTLERSIKAKDRGSMKRDDMNQDKIAEMSAKRKAHQDKLESILTPEQLKTLKESRETAMKRRGENMKRSPKPQKNTDSTQE